jgi:hypothetical protein
VDRIRLTGPAATNIGLTRALPASVAFLCQSLSETILGPVWYQPIPRLRFGLPLVAFLTVGLRFKTPW